MTQQIATGEDLINVLLKPLGTNLKHYEMAAKNEALATARAVVDERDALLKSLKALQHHFAGMASTPKSSTLLGLLANADCAIARATGGAA